MNCWHNLPDCPSIVIVFIFRLKWKDIETFRLHTIFVKCVKCVNKNISVSMAWTKNSIIVWKLFGHKPFKSKSSKNWMGNDGNVLIGQIIGMVFCAKSYTKMISNQKLQKEFSKLFSLFEYQHKPLEAIHFNE